MPTILKAREDFLVGLISDTHGVLNPAVMKLFDGVHEIIHAGDIGAPDVLDVLGRIAPVIAVRGNMDGGSWISDLPDVKVVEVGKVILYVLHDLHQLDLDPYAAGFNAIISGHTHRTAIREQNGILYVNPGSASFPGINYAATIALLRISGERLTARIVEI
ncbi:MAG: metallophosphoesterase family protein [Deltaproteobacteria bacterium]|nr:MAG: metallophosphoesterase family protein [Deltaproteobacteria bacterium]